MLSDLNIKFKYDSNTDDLINEFYIPTLSNSISYYLMSGFFSTNSIIHSIKGISKLIENNGKIKLLCSAKLSKNDLKSIENDDDFERIIEKLFNYDLNSIEDKVTETYIEALGWMLNNKLLEIKIAIDRHNNVFHSKIGILNDMNGDMLSFSGLDNYTINNLRDEEFKVFRSWDASEEKFVKQDLKDFLHYWEGHSDKIIIDLPKSIKIKLINKSPQKKSELNIITEENGLNNIKLRNYQIEAIKSWKYNNFKGIFEMATGTGKTFTALAAFKKLSDSKDKLLTVIACPQNHLIDQWINNIKKFDVEHTIVASGKNPKWKSDLTNLKKDFYFGLVNKAVVMTSHVSLYSDFFIDTISKFNAEKLLIIDEVHGIGSSKQQLGLIEDYDYRLGLSATPTRWLDLKGTEVVLKYFGGIVFRFDIEKALTEINPTTGKTYLTPYSYNPIIVDLTKEEYKQYNYYANKIEEVMNKEKYDENQFENLCNQRKEILDNAYAKYCAFIKILEEDPKINKLIVFCSHTQIDKVQSILNDKRIIPQHRFTYHQSAIKTKKNPISERELILKKFSEGSYKALVAIKCLDEGVDIPSAENAIILSSTSNPREHVQRRGRILRRFPGKEKAKIYDILVFPNDKTKYGSNIVKKDIKRYYEFAKNATNSYECLKLLKKIYSNY